MGIPGIYQEIGPGERIALAKLAIQKFEQTGRLLRLAIDISIWNFQTQSGQGGANPALRVLYFRLLRLLSLSIEAVFVFDGPKRPRTKRGTTRTGSASGYADERRTKNLIKLLGFETHDAPGEAEAECAILQKAGIVDAVLSEDVDTLMFGSGLTLRDWSAEGAGKVPSHVTAYDAGKTREGRSGLDREGMILVALMSGGDYDTDGIARCGVKVACEAARAGFGRELCRLGKDDDEGFAEWRERLAHELYTNESNFFRQKSKAIVIPEDFPKREILGYYTHPAVSSSSEVQTLKEKLTWNKAPNVAALRAYVEDVFQWTGKFGAKKMIRGLAPAMLVYQLRERDNRRKSTHGDILLTQANEMEFVRCITGERIHDSTGGELELRVTYQPSSIVPWDLDSEIDSEIPEGGACVDEDGSNEGNSSDIEAIRTTSRSPMKRNLETYDPTALEKVWIPRCIVRVGIPLKVEDYEEAKMEKEMGKSPKKPKPKAAVTKPKAKKGTGMKPGALDRYVATMKPLQPVKELARTRSEPVKEDRRRQELPPLLLASMLEKATRTKSTPNQAREKVPSPLPSQRSLRSSPPPEPGHTSPLRRKWKAPPEGSPTPPRREHSALAVVIEASQPSPTVRPRREHWKVKPTSRATSSQKPTSQTSILQAFNSTRATSSQRTTSKTSILQAFNSIKQCSRIKSGDESSESRVRENKVHSSSFSQVDPYQIPDSSLEPEKTKKHPRQRTPPTPTLQATRSSPKNSCHSLLAGHGTPTPLANKRAPFQRAKTIAAEPSDEDEDELPSLGRVFRNSPHAKRTLGRVQADSKTIKESPSILIQGQELKEAEVIDLLSSPISQPNFGRLSTLNQKEKSPQLGKQQVIPTQEKYSFPANFSQQKRFLAKRESLPGAWKEFTEEEVEAQVRRGGKERKFYRKSGVKVLDLTKD